MKIPDPIKLDRDVWKVYPNMCARWPSRDPSTIPDLIEELVYRLPDGDLHISHLRDEWKVGSCHSHDALTDWVQGKTLNEALCRALVKAAKPKAAKKK